MGRLTKRVINQVKKTKSKKKKQTMKKKLFKTRLLSFAAFCGFTLMFASCANEDIAQNPNSTDNDKNLTTFTAGDLSTRTSMESDGKFFWETGDKIWVKDDNGIWRQSSNAPTAKTASFKFKVPGKFTQSSTYKVYYPGKNGNQDQVTIPATQSQSEPNTTTHFGTSGDCGMADAAWSNSKNGFAFTLDHKAAYLRFLPRTSNDVLHDCFLTKIEVTSDNDITDTYILDKNTGKLTGTGTGKQIILTTQGSGSYANGFPLTNNATSATTNGSYMIIKPGTHTLNIRYWVKDVVTNIEGTITKVLTSKVFDQNKYYDITADLQVHNYDGDHYYMWDAQDQYWHNYEWSHHNSTWQPTLNISLGGTTSTFFPKSNSDSRWYHEGGGTSRFDATQTCASLPNANEITWYVSKGEPHWDADGVWATMGHLYKGGMWLKKKAYIVGFSSEHMVPPFSAVDMRVHNLSSSNNTIINGLPSATEINKFFFLPALGKYVSGHLQQVGVFGYYWSSSSNPVNSTPTAYLIYFSKSTIQATNAYRTDGCRVQPFE